MSLFCLRYNLPSNLSYKSHQILKLKRFLFRLAVGSAQSIEAMCKVDNKTEVGVAPTAML